MKQVYKLIQAYLSYSDLFWTKSSDNKPGLIGKLVLWNSPLVIYEQ